VLSRHSTARSSDDSHIEQTPPRKCAHRWHPRRRATYCTGWTTFTSGL